MENHTPNVFELSHNTVPDDSQSQAVFQDHIDNQLRVNGELGGSEHDNQPSYNDMQPEENNGLDEGSLEQNHTEDERSDAEMDTDQAANENEMVAETLDEAESREEGIPRELLRQQIEALIFASDEALPVKTIIAALEDPNLTPETVQELVDELNQVYDDTGRVFRIQKIAQGYRFLTQKRFHGTIQKLLQPKLQRKLSQAALETLAVVAYKQPISKTEIEAIRGTNADYVVRVLLEKNLIEVSGRANTVGKPLLYSTTKEFLDYFNLSSLADLPKPREIDELMREGDAREMLKADLKDRITLEIEEDNNRESQDSESETTEQE